MIKECILAKTGVQFDLEYLKESVDEGEGCQSGGSWRGIRGSVELC